MNTPAPHSHEPILSRRQFGALVLAGTMGGAVELLRPDEQKKGPPKRSPLVSLKAAQRLAMNAEETEKIWRMGAARYMQDLRRRGFDLLKESDPLEEKVECVDERQEDGLTECVAGLGVHVNAMQRTEIARGIVQSAVAKYKEQRKKGRDVPVRIRLTWHGEGMCGAATLACKQDDPNKHFTAEEIDKKAEQGALQLATEITSQLKALGMDHACLVSVDQVPPETVLHADGHPAGVTLINVDPEMVFNRDGEPLLTYGTSVTISRRQGIADAVLTGKIQMGNHGRKHAYRQNGHHDDEHAQHEELKQTDRPLYVVHGPSQLVGAVRDDLLRALKQLPEDEALNIFGDVHVVTTDNRPKKIIS